MRGFLVAVMLVALAYALAFILFVSTLPQTPQLRPEADGIVALTGGGARLDAAEDLFEKGVGRRLLISGVALATTKDTLAHMVDAGPRFGCCADLGYAAEDTRGNAAEAAEWARQHGFHSLVIVTARYHMPRAMEEFGRVMPDITLLPWPVEQGSIDLAGWWHHRGTIKLLNREFVKYLASVALRLVSKIL